jgi:membrane protein YdbS with pleckstrin-like domain
VSAGRALEPEVVTVWRISAGLWWTVPILAAIAFDVVYLFRDAPLPPGVLTLSALVLATLYITLVPRLRYRFWRWQVVGDALHVERGIVNRVRTLVPLRRVQHLDVSQNLLEREHELGKLIVHTAGTQNHTVTLPGLRHDEAVALRDRLKAYLDADAL